MTFRNLLLAAAITTKLATVGLLGYWLATPSAEEPNEMLAACPWCYGDPACEDSACEDCE